MSKKYICIYAVTGKQWLVFNPGGRHGLLVFEQRICTACPWHGQMTPCQTTTFSASWWSFRQGSLPSPQKDAPLSCVGAARLVWCKARQVTSGQLQQQRDSLCCTDAIEGLPWLCCSNSSKPWSNIILKYYSCSQSNCLPWSRKNFSLSTAAPGDGQKKEEAWMCTASSPRTS